MHIDSQKMGKLQHFSASVLRGSFRLRACWFCREHPAKPRRESRWRHRFRGLLHFANAVEPLGKMATRRNRVAYVFLAVAAHAAETTPQILASSYRCAILTTSHNALMLFCQQTRPTTCLALLTSNSYLPLAFATCALLLFGRHFVAPHVSYPCAAHHIPSAFAFLTCFLRDELFTIAIWACNAIACCITFIACCAIFFYGIVGRVFGCL